MFPVSFAKFLVTPFLTEYLPWPFLLKASKFKSHQAIFPVKSKNLIGKAGNNGLYNEIKTNWMHTAKKGNHVLFVILLIIQLACKIY